MFSSGCLGDLLFAYHLGFAAIADAIAGMAAAAALGFGKDGHGRSFGFCRNAKLSFKGPSQLFGGGILFLFGRLGLFLCHDWRWIDGSIDRLIDACSVARESPKQK